ncbi:MAG: hypothetical protein MUC99_09540 [Anaerolineae bacterium]|jgi:hypothetical protein|nr:hypothetical protein [Anaerolineae bacterium]
MFNPLDPQLAQLRQRELLERAQRRNQHRAHQPNPLMERLQTALDSVRQRPTPDAVETQERARLPWMPEQA